MLNVHLSHLVPLPNMNPVPPTSAGNKNVMRRGNIR